MWQRSLHLLWPALILTVCLLLATAAQAVPLADTPPPAPPDLLLKSLPNAPDVPPEFPMRQMNYQGYLTDGAGAPLSGTYAMTFRMYSSGYKMWGDEVHPAVVVDRGYFHVVLGETLPINPWIFSMQQHLEVQIGSTVLPNQTLHAVPYAMGLVIGARSYGGTVNADDYGLSVGNMNGHGIWAGGRTGAWGVYSQQAIYAGDGYAGPETIAWVPSGNATMSDWDRQRVWSSVGGWGEYVIERTGEPVSVNVVFPVQVERPYGRNFYATELQFYYVTSAPSAYIDRVSVNGMNFVTGDFLTAASSNENGAGLGYSAYTLPISPTFAISDTQSLTAVTVQMYMDDHGFANFFGVRLKLASQP